MNEYNVLPPHDDSRLLPACPRRRVRCCSRKLRRTWLTSITSAALPRWLRWPAFPRSAQLLYI